MIKSYSSIGSGFPKRNKSFMKCLHCFSHPDMIHYVRKSEQCSPVLCFLDLWNYKIHFTSARTDSVWLTAEEWELYVKISEGTS